jgi:hypothetical protein
VARGGRGGNLAAVRYRIGRVLQLAGLLVTGYVCVRAFGGDVSEGDMFKYGLGGFAVFWIGTGLVKGGA